MDFTVPPLTSRVLYCFLVIGHVRRQLLHFNVTEHRSLDNSTEGSISGMLSLSLRDSRSRW
jgi:hypothetical protein